MSKSNTGNKFIKIEAIDAKDNNANYVLETDRMPVIPVRGYPVFPNMILPVTISRESTLQLVDDAISNSEVVALVAQRNPNVEQPSRRDLYDTGVVATLLKKFNLPDGTTSVLVRTGPRVELKAIKTRSPYLRGRMEYRNEILPDSPEDRQKLAVLIKTNFDSFDELLKVVDNDETKEILNSMEGMEEPEMHIAFVQYNAPFSNDEKISLLQTDNVMERMQNLNSKLSEALRFIRIRSEIHQKTAEQLTRQQRDHFLQQQMRVLQEELGTSVEDEDANQLAARAKKMTWSKEVRKHFEKELRKLDRFNAQNPEYSIQYQYLDTFLSLPWGKTGKQMIDVDRVRQVLDEDHYGLEDVKERIMEQVAVLKLRNDMRAPILCLYGPPGVGKTSLGKSIARALGREYARISLGGMHDEAEIRGHRRTYIGALPGRVITALKSCETNNPVIVLDEVDKIGHDFKGDPSTALLEVLDPEQNSHFHDNYIDYDYDLSRVMFIATANDLSGVSRPLLDRMELVEITGYVTEEKIEIGRRHLVGKMLVEHGFSADEIEFTPEALRKIIESYTRESGVRLLEKKIAKVIRRIGMLKASDKPYPKVITPKEIDEFMGPEEVIPDVISDEPEVGVVTGLAWTSVGGEVLFIETALVPGKGEKLTLTGNLGDVMKESAQIALQYLKAHADEIGIKAEIFTTKDVHIHVPEGAVPKDGPSAGITIATALTSVLTGRKVRPRIAMTGEMTLRGKVLPVGGIKEKILAAKRSGAKEIILCYENKKDINKIPEQYLEGLTFHYVKSLNEVLKLALLPNGEQQ